MQRLCDSNVFIALAVENHPQHERAVEWIAGLAEDEKLSFCRPTQISFLRLLTAREMMRENVCTNEEAVQKYEELRSDSRVIFVDEPAGIEDQFLQYCKHREPSPKRWMDAYLAAFAVSGKMRLASFDRGFRVFKGLDLELLAS